MRRPLHGRDPEYRVLRIPPWRIEGERVLVEDKETGLEQSWNAWTGDVLEGLAQNEDYPAILARLERRWPERRRTKSDSALRRFFYTLHRLKAIELLFEMPTAFGDGRYETIKELGRGGVGVAWLCRDSQTQREVVVKRAWDYFAPIARTDALVRAELEVMRRLDHPRIAKAYDAFEEDGLIHLVREFARGEELSRWRGKGVDPKTRRTLALDIADIVAHLHERGFLLLDMRPANFFVEPATMRAMLIDVGHCKPMTRGVVDLGIPARGKAHGSPGFAAPETSKEGKATPRTDVWGFGRLYSFIATGQLPRSGMDIDDLLARMDALGASDEDRRVVARCAEDDPAGRPPTMRDAAALLS